MASSNSYMNAYMKNRYQKRRQAAIEYCGNTCLVCGSSDDLQFHHKDPQTKLLTIADALASRSDKELHNELDKCILLCASCHKLEHKAITIHGKLYTYKKGCRCEKCTEANSKHSYVYKKKKKLKEYRKLKGL